MPLFLMGCFPVDFQEVKRPLRTKSVKRPIKVGKRPLNEGKRPIKAKVLVGVSVGCLMGCFRAPPPWRKTAPLKRPIKRSMKCGLLSKLLASIPVSLRPSCPNHLSQRHGHMRMHTPLQSSVLALCCKQLSRRCKGRFQKREKPRIEMRKAKHPNETAAKRQKHCRNISEEFSKPKSKISQTFYFLILVPSGSLKRTKKEKAHRRQLAIWHLPKPSRHYKQKMQLRLQRPNRQN